MTTRRYPQVKRLDTAEKFRAHLDSLGVELAFRERTDVEPLSEPLTIVDGSAGSLRVANRFAALPMEGWDGGVDGSVTDLVRRRWQRLGHGGAGLVWGEATAVVPEGRANPNQLVIDETTIDGLAALRASVPAGPIVGLQLTHSGRFSRPDAEGPAPRTAYRHPLLDRRVGADVESVLSDDELDALVERFIGAAALADRAGFDFVDVKACHGYLSHELLSAVDRPGRYGGTLDGRTTFLRSVIAGIRERSPGLAIGVRLSLFDVSPFRPGADGVGEPEAEGDYRYAFGGDGTGAGIDLTEPLRVLQLLRDLGVGLVCVTAGSPYSCPHVQRPAYFPPSDGYAPPEDPLVGVARLLDATAAITAAQPEMTIVGTGYSYVQQWLPEVARGAIAAGAAGMVGLGRMMLSYPHLPRDVLAGRMLEQRAICRTFSDCTTAPRAGLVSGCYPLDPFYRERPERLELAARKRAMRRPPGEDG